MPEGIAAVVLAQGVFNHVDFVAHLGCVTFGNENNLAELTQNVALVRCSNRLVVIVFFVQHKVLVLLRHCDRP